MDSRPGWVVYLGLLLAWTVLGFARRLRADRASGPEERRDRSRTLILFVVAWAVVAGFLKYLQRRGLEPFGYYRIVLGVLVIWWMR